MKSRTVVQFDDAYGRSKPVARLTLDTNDGLSADQEQALDVLVDHAAAQLKRILFDFPTADEMDRRTEELKGAFLRELGIGG